MGFINHTEARMTNLNINSKLHHHMFSNFIDKAYHQMNR
jgi:hypothetical protein